MICSHRRVILTLSEEIGLVLILENYWQVLNWLDTGTDDKKYDLVWEDRFLLSGKSFYLPGSIDTDDKQLLQSNNVTPPLSLWSRSDWTGKHREIATRCHHMWLPVQLRISQPPTWNYLMEEQKDCFGDFSGVVNEYGDLHSILDDIPEPHGKHDRGSYNLCGDIAMNNNRNNLGRQERDLSSASFWERENVASFSPVAALEDMDTSPIKSLTCN